ncbi:MAG: hypothetical protein HYV97_00475 [Bdellovibrio sp.]|nr:hypothetical protein [Bdellovibrio sp.]
MKTLLIGMVCAFALNFGASAQSIGSPHVPDGDTIALWNFDTDSGNTVADQGQAPLRNCTAYSATLAPLPDLDSAYQNGRNFTGGSGSFIECGVARGTKLDFEGMTELTIEAVVRLNANATGTHVIFDNNQVQLVVTGNKVAAFISQTGGFQGVVGSATLAINTNHRIAMVFGNGYLAVFVDGYAQGNVAISAPIGAIINAGAVATIGGTAFGFNFPGYVDDVSISGVARLDNVPPEIVLNSPHDGEVLNVARPNFNIGLSDNGTGVNVSTVQAFQNDILQTGLVLTATSITGQMDTDLSAGMINTIKIVVRDNQGNRAEKIFTLTRLAVGARAEYTPDADTLALWHMNENTNGFITDSSGREYHGFNPNNQSSGTIVAEGVFGNGREISYSGGSGKFHMPPIRLPGQKFTFETWLRSNNNTTATLFNTDQITIQRITTGFIRVMIKTRIRTYTFETLIDWFLQGELHHFAVTWDGTNPAHNLVIYRDGIIVETFNAPNNCDFDPTPKIAMIGESFTGLLDEMRFSSVVRTTFNVPTIQEVGIFFLTLQNGTSVNNEFPAVNVNINSLVGINPQNIAIKLNEVDQTSSAGLTITASNISGTMTSPVVSGINTVEVSYTDNQGNQKKKQQFFFYIQNAGGGAYTADSGTAVLLHFEEPNATDIVDSSNQHNVFVADSPSTIITIPGVIGNARMKSGINSVGQTVDLGTRSFTLEGFFKLRTDITPSSWEQPLISVTRSGFGANVNLNPVTGKMRFDISTSSGYKTENVAGAFPLDSEFHHVAIIFDSSREFAQFMLLVDGQVKRAVDFDCHCNFDGPMDVSLDYYSLTIVDEIRLSSIPRYSFNYDVTARPQIIGLSPMSDATVHTLTPSVEYVFTDPVGIASVGTLLKVNGVEQANLSLDLMGFNGTLSGTVSGLIPGTNEFELRVKNTQGKEQVQKFYVFVILDGGSLSYEDDLNTLGLYHFNETSGSIIVDSSSSAADFNFTDIFDLNVPGLFSTTGISVSSHQSDEPTVPGLNGLGNYTLEGWLGFSAINSYLYSYKIGSLETIFSSGSFSFTGPTAVGVLNYPNAVADLNFHHYAVIVDSNSTRRNALFVVDGEVKASALVPTTALTIASSSLNIFRYFNNTIFAEEFRISKVSRYTLNYLQSKRKQQELLGAQ